MTADVRLQGEITGGETVVIIGQAPEGVERAVVTRSGGEVGTTVSSGNLLGAVSNRPIIGLSLTIPLYRDIRIGDSGPDVASLQEALGVERTGVLDFPSTEAIRALYAQIDFLPPGGVQGTYVETAEVQPLPITTQQLTVQQRAVMGTEISESNPLVTFSLGSEYVSVRASVREADQIANDSPVVVSSTDGVSLNATVSSIGEFQSQSTSAGRPPGRDVRIELPREADLSPGETISVLFGSEAQPVKAVPTIAIRSDAAGDYVLLGAQRTRTDVTVDRNANGWTAITSDQVSIGDQVLVSE